MGEEGERDVVSCFGGLEREILEWEDDESERWGGESLEVTLGGDGGRERERVCVVIFFVGGSLGFGLG